MSTSSCGDDIKLTVGFILGECCGFHVRRCDRGAPKSMRFKKSALIYTKLLQ